MKYLIPPTNEHNDLEDQIEKILLRMNTVESNVEWWKWRERAPSLSKNNHDAVVESDVCGCYFCMTAFESSKVQEWTDDGTTAICPRCDTDAVIPNVGDVRGLIEFHKRWFTKRV